MVHALKHIIRFDLRKCIIGVIFAALVLAIYGIWFDWMTGVMFASIFLVAGCVRLDAGHDIVKGIWNILWSIALVWVTWYVSMLVVDAVGRMLINSHKQILNIFCILVVCGALFVLTANWKLSFMVASCLLVLLSAANGFIHQFRGKELGPMDILSIETALNVAGQYNPVCTPNMVYGWSWWLAILFIGFSIPKFPKLPPVRVRVAALLIEMIFVASLWSGAAGIPIKTWDDEGTRLNGYYLNFFLGIRDSIVEKPKSYAPKTVSEYAQDYILSDTMGEHKSLPNVIVIMDESYADFDILGEELRTSQPVTPFLDSLEKNTIRGYALTSVHGGNTANAEFEFLTGHSMAFLPENVVPHQQYIRDEIYTLAWLMNSYGYKSAFTHPYYANGWSRDQVYPYFGFTENTFIENYPREDIMRHFVSDREMFRYVLQNLADDSREEPLFLFGITMQNHGGYDYVGENFTQTIRLEGYADEYPKAEQYLSLIHETDAAMKDFLAALQDYPEDTLVLFFGDHFPGIEPAFYEELHGGAFDTLQEQVLQYQIPFIIWANYDIPEEQIDCTSLSYLSRYLLEAAGLELPPYYRFLKDMENTIPALNAMGYYSISQNAFITFDSATGEEAEWLDRYAIVQYNNLFDEKNRNPVFFGQYITP